MNVGKCAAIATAVVALMALTPLPALAQVDLSGTWIIRNHEDQAYRNGGPTIGDYMGLPINDEARARADAWQPSLLGKPEHQCIMYTSFYLMQQVFSLEIDSEADPITGEIIGFTINGIEDRAPFTVWMDGRPHPSPSAPHSSPGFTTGTWDGDMLVAHTTHLTEGILWRNGVPHSDRATITSFFARHEMTLTITMIMEDPVYLEEPLIRNTSFQWDPAAGLFLDTCQPQVEAVQAPETVPHYLPGTNPFLNEVWRLFKIPAEASRDGAATMYPEYRKKLQGYVPPSRSGAANRP